MPMAKELANRGHKIYIVSPYKGISYKLNDYFVYLEFNSQTDRPMIKDVRQVNLSIVQWRAQGFAPEILKHRNIQEMLKLVPSAAMSDTIH